MRKIREILRLRFDAGLSIRQISSSTKASTGTVQALLARANQMNLVWPLPDDMSDQQLAKLFYPDADTRSSRRLEVPDWAEVHQQLKRKGMTKQLLWEEYAAVYPNRCYSYSQFCDRYRHWAKQQKRSMRQVHRAGEKCFVDYCGQTVGIIDVHTGKVHPAQIFVGVLGASNYTFAEATWSQSLPDWLGSHCRMFDYFGGCTEMVIPDNLRSGVSKPCRYDPDLNPSYQQWAAHYKVAVLPARPYKPKDKAKAEVGVQIVERWVLARLRHQSFFSLSELNRCIRALLVELNAKAFKQLPGNRTEAFKQLDQPALRPLPEYPYQYTEVKRVKVTIDYHVQHDQHHYSVPHQYVGYILEMHISSELVRLIYQSQEIAVHPRKRRPGITTDALHMPKRHSQQHKWTPGRLKNWAKDIGPETLTWVSQQLDSKAHPEQAYRVCLGLLGLSRDYPSYRVDKACGIANQQGMTRLKHIRSILSANRDKLASQASIDQPLPDHDNIRGPHSFH